MMLRPIWEMRCRFARFRLALTFITLKSSPGPRWPGCAQRRTTGDFNKHRRRLRTGEDAFRRDSTNSRKCLATIGQVGNVDHMNVSSGKAGRTRWQGRRPHVRGMVMNPIDHPMGGGQGKSKGGGGRHHPVSPWGQLAKGFKTRAKHKPSDRFILERDAPRRRSARRNSDN